MAEPNKPQNDDRYDPFGKNDGASNGSGGDPSRGTYRDPSARPNGFTYGNNGNGQGSNGSFYGPDYFAGGGYGGNGGGFGGYGGYTGGARPQKQRSAGYGFSLASMILGICAFLFCCSTVISIVLGVLAIVFSIIGGKRDGKMSGYAIAGLVLGIIAIVFAIVILVASMTLMEDDSFMQWLEEYLQELEGSQSDGGTSGGGTGGGTDLPEAPSDGGGNRAPLSFLPSLRLK